jgi:uracil-DNA glycosylase
MISNIYKALVKDPKVNFALPSPLHGDTESWADKGVLMLNNSLTTRKDQQNSHSKAGWNKFTKAVLQAINDEKSGVIFLIWGGQSHKIAKLIDKKKHHVLTYGNPSPLSQKFQKFEDCTNFSKVNEILKEKGQSEIDWNVD